MGKFEELLDFINELNENGRIPYDDYSRLFDLASELGRSGECPWRSQSRYCRLAAAEWQLRILRTRGERGIQRRKQVALSAWKRRRLPPRMARRRNKRLPARDT